MTIAGTFLFNQSNAGMTIYGKGGIVSGGGLTQVCPDQDAAVCATTSFSPTTIKPGDLGTINFQGTVYLAKVETISGTVSEDGEIQGQDIVFEIEKK